MSLHQFRQRFSTARSQGPAKGSVAGIEEQVFPTGGADQGAIGRGGGTQSRPRGYLRIVGQMGEQLAGALDQRFQTGAVQAVVVAGELGGARYA